jgi:hypothetical protein
VTVRQICAAVICPHPPLLLPELAAGAAGRLSGLLMACDEALAAGLASAPDRVVVVGAGEVTARFGARDRSAAAGFVAPPAVVSEPRSPALPLSLSVGRFLLSRSGWSGPTEYWAIASDAAVTDCVALGKHLSDGPSALFLVLGDGSGVGRNAPPGAAVPAAEPFDDAVWAALGEVDTAALLRLDVAEAEELKAAGRAAWQVLSGAVDAAGGAWSAHGHHRESPYGVGYFVVSWTR